MKLEFSPHMLEKYFNMKFYKIRPVGTELFHVDWLKDGRTDGQTDMAKLIISFRNFAKAPKMGGAYGMCGFGGKAWKNKATAGKM